MKAVMISIQPKWCELIALGKKTVEVRKTRPKIDVPFKVYIYCTKSKGGTFSMEQVFDGWDIPIVGNGMVIGEFVCDRIYYIGWLSTPAKLDWKNHYNKDSCLTNSQLYDYSNGGCYYEWHISNLVIYDKPRELSEFRSYNVRAHFDESGYLMPTHEIKRPPQSWCYVEKIE